MRLSAVAELQRGYKSLMKHGMTKKQLCDLVIPFRDRWELTDKQALQIARGEMPLATASELMKREDDQTVLRALMELNQQAPMPWSVKADILSGYVKDASGDYLFGGDNNEGRVDYAYPWMKPLIELTKAFATSQEVFK